MGTCEPACPDPVSHVNLLYTDAASCDEAISILGCSLEITKCQENRKSTSNLYSLQPSSKACQFSSRATVANEEEVGAVSASETDKTISLNKTQVMKNKVKSSLEPVGLSALETPTSRRQLNSRTSVVTDGTLKKDSAAQKHLERSEKSNSSCECDLRQHMQEGEKEQRNFDTDKCYGSVTSFNDPNALSRSGETFIVFCPEFTKPPSSEIPMQANGFVAPVKKNFGLSKKEPLSKQFKAAKKCCHCKNLLVNSFCHHLRQRIDGLDSLKSEIQQQQFLPDEIKKRANTIPPCGQSQRQNETIQIMPAQKPLQSQSNRLYSDALSHRRSVKCKSTEMEINRKDIGSSLLSYNRPQNGTFHPCHCLQTPISMSISMIPFVTPLTQPLYEGGTEQCAEMYGVKKTKSVSQLKGYGATPQSFPDFERVCSNRDYAFTTSCLSSDLCPRCFELTEHARCQRAPEHAQYLLRPDISQSSRRQEDIVGKATGRSAEGEEKETMI